jgi:acylphosphatase
VALLLEWLDEGPRGARVDRVDVSELAPVGESEFSTRH